MPKFMAVHTFPINGMSVEQCKQLSEASQHDPIIRGDRSFMSLSGGKAVCIIDAPKREDLENWFKQMKLPFDCIAEVELEAESGGITELSGHVPVH